MAGIWTKSRFSKSQILICVPIALFVMKEKPEQMGLKPLGYGEEAGNDKKKNKAPQIAAEENFIPLKYAKNYGFFHFLMIGILFTGVFTTASGHHVFPYFSELYGPVFAATMMSFGSAMAIIGKLVARW